MKLKFKVAMKSVLNFSGSRFDFTYMADCYSDGSQITCQCH